MSCSFSISHYRTILETALDHGYAFIGFDELPSLPAGQRACILRHDIDYLPGRAIVMGEIEAELGIRASYFFQIVAQTYNLREANNYRVLHQLKALGHTIGLHFDASWKDDAEWEELPALCDREKVAFEALTQISPCEMISFHNPHRFADRVLDQTIPGMRHSYEPALFSQIKYLSDSQGWYEGCVCKLFEQRSYPVIQLLTHPYIWPDAASGDFITDMASMITDAKHRLTEYLIRYHPVCARHADRLRALVNAATPDED